MKTLLLLRHGKAAPVGASGDHERPLVERGHEQSRSVGTLLHRLGLDPELALVSDAVRTRETAELALAACGSSLTIKDEPALYDASAAQILAVVQREAGPARCILVVGHNPGIGDLARRLAGSGEPQALIEVQGGFPTGSLAALEFGPEPWTEVAFGAGTLTRFITPGSAE